MLLKGESAMRKVLIPLILVLLILLLIFIYWYNYAGKMVSNSVESVKNIAITVYPCDEQKKEIRTIDDTYEIKNIYSILNKTTKIRSNRHPSHAVSVQWDPKFEIDIIYRNGEREHIFSTEKTGFICKYINSTRDSDDRGFRSGENQYIWDYILSE